MIVALLLAWIVVVAFGWQSSIDAFHGAATWLQGLPAAALYGLLAAVSAVVVATRWRALTRRR